MHCIYTVRSVRQLGAIDVRHPAKILSSTRHTHLLVGSAAAGFPEHLLFFVPFFVVVVVLFAVAFAISIFITFGGRTIAVAAAATASTFNLHFAI